MREQQMFIERWSQSGQQDAYYHPALSADYLSGPYGGLATPPRPTAARTPQPPIANIRKDRALPSEAIYDQVTPATTKGTADYDPVSTLIKQIQPISIGVQL
jgi:hypothetical protein